MNEDPGPLHMDDADVLNLACEAKSIPRCAFLLTPFSSGRLRPNRRIRHETNGYRFGYVRHSWYRLRCTRHPAVVRILQNCPRPVFARGVCPYCEGEFKVNFESESPSKKMCNKALAKVYSVLLQFYPLTDMYYYRTANQRWRRHTPRWCEHRDESACHSDFQPEIPRPFLQKFFAVP
jgi:hypothetical protein